MPEYDNYSSEQNRFKVKISDTRRTTGARRTVVFDVTPDLSEMSSVNYETIDIPHGPGQLFVYSSSSSRSFRLNVNLVSRTRDEATRNLARLNLIRAWTKPVFGSNAILTGETLNRVSPELVGNIRSAIQDRASLNSGDVLGAPPRVLSLSAYSDAAHRGMLYKIPVVITDMGITYPEDVDYIPTGPLKGFEDISVGTPFPTMMTIDINLAESHSPRDFSSFNINAYRLGILEGF